jgi:hypothetical protein
MNEEKSMIVTMKVKTDISYRRYDDFCLNSKGFEFLEAFAVYEHF